MGPDLILEIDRILYHIEIKIKTNPVRDDMKALGSFCEKYHHEHLHKGLIICNIVQPQELAEDVVAVPWWIL